MIVVLSPDPTPERIAAIERAIRAAGGDPKRLEGDGRIAIEARGADPSLLGDLPGVDHVLEPRNGHPKVARRSAETRKFAVGSALVGGDEIVLSAGPCAVESEEQLSICARAVAEAGAKLLRGGAYKPRTSPYSFQGLEEEGLRLLRRVADRHGLAVVTEVMEPAQVPLVAEHADMLQIGSRNMQNFALLKAVGRARRPVLLKRGMSATLEEWLLAAEYVADGGNERIVLCERGVRSFDPAARNVLDLVAVPLLRARTDLPIFVDPSHGVGVRGAIPAAARAAAAIGADGIVIEIHPDPGAAKSDGFQAIPTGEFPALASSIRRVASASRSG